MRGVGGLRAREQQAANHLEPKAAGRGKKNAPWRRVVGALEGKNTIVL